MARLGDLLAAAATDPARRPEFFRALMESQVLVFGWANQPPVHGRAQPGTSMQVLSWSDDSGTITPFFTSEDTLKLTLDRRPGTDRRYVGLPARALVEMLRGNRFVLDPDAPYGRTFTADEIFALLDGRDIGREPQVVEKETKVLVGAAAYIPPDLPRVLVDFFAKRPVVRAHLGWIAYPATGEDGYLLVVVADDRDAAMQGFGMLQVSDLTGGKNIDAIVVPPSQRDHFLSSVPPFYERRRLGGKLGSLFGRQGRRSVRNRVDTAPTLTRMTYVALIRVLGGWMVLRLRHPGGCSFDIVAGPFPTEETAQAAI